ncbi:MAG: hypothetical protein SOY37_09680 [Oscillospiraceae bacterium]|nr:hypothetical protein [Oscillospiraceae bacterium]
MEMKQKNRFWKGLLIYILVMLVIIFTGLFVFWKFIAAYEQSRPEGVMDAWVQEAMEADLSDAVDAWAQAHETPWQSAERIREGLTEALAAQTIHVRKEPGEETETYQLRAGRTVIGTKTLDEVPGGGLFDFGFTFWEVGEGAYDFSPFASTLTILAPETAEVSLNGAVLDRASAQSGGVHPELAEFEETLADTAGILTYTVEDLYMPGTVTATDPSGCTCLTETAEDGSVSVALEMPVDLKDELAAYAEGFVTAYIGYTSNATGGPGAVQSYMIPGSLLYQRMTAAMVGMVWVHGVTSTMSDLTVDHFRYYDNAVLCEAQYQLTTESGTSDNHMRILLTNTDAGWRVADMNLF